MSDRSLEHLKPGDDVILCDVNFRSRTTKVEKVGRVNLYVKGHNAPFERKTGACKDGHGSSSLMSVERHDHMQRVHVARTKLRAYGVEVSRGDDFKVLAVFEALKHLLG